MIILVPYFCVDTTGDSRNGTILCPLKSHFLFLLERRQTFCLGRHIGYFSKHIFLSNEKIFYTKSLAKGGGEAMPKFQPLVTVLVQELGKCFEKSWIAWFQLSQNVKRLNIEQTHFLARHQRRITAKWPAPSIKSTLLKTADDFTSRGILRLIISIFTLQHLHDKKRNRKFLVYTASQR